MGEGFSVADRTLCVNCAEKFLSEQPPKARNTTPIARLADPTICVHCSADAGDQELSKLAGLPTCETCENFFRNRPYPGWLKFAFVVFICVAVGAFIYNMRFFLAYVDLVKANHLADRGKTEQAMVYFASASDRLPEMPELAVVPNLYRAARLAEEDKYEEATALINKIRASAPPELRPTIRFVELQVQMGQAFDRKDYDTFLSTSQELVKLRGDDPMHVGSVASAFACKYATTGDEKFRDSAKEYLDRARALVKADDAEPFKAYESRIQHRLATREIITEAEFQKRFPNGWKPEDKK
jgi:hypothetical protein